jgi:hypothetical protein
LGAGLADAGEGLPVAPLGEPAQELRVELASSAGAVMDGADVAASVADWEAPSAPMWAAISPKVGTSVSNRMAVFWT